MWNSKLWCLALFTGVVTGCGNLPAANQPKPESSDGSTESTPEPPEPAAAANVETATQSESHEPQPQATEVKSIEQLCAPIATRAAERCPKRVAEFYATNCRRYAKATKCQAEIARMLECQLNTPDELLCAHQADPNCTEVNSQLLVCDKGKTRIEQTQPEDLTLPTGWTNIQDSKLGFTVAMPPGATVEENGPKAAWKAQEGDITYVVETAEPPAGKVTSGSLLRTIMKYLGSRCQLQLKVRGEFEIKGVTVVQYESGCTDGTQWRGMMHVWDGKAVSTGLRGPKGSRGVLEPYFYSFSVSH